MKFIPDVILEMGSSKKAVSFWVIVAMWSPLFRSEIDFGDTALVWITVAFCAYALAQGLSDALAAKAVK